MSSYWEKRQAQIMYNEMADAEKTAQELADIYAKATREINFQIEEIFDRFTDKHDLTEDEAKRLLGMLKDPTDIQEMMDKLKADPKNADLLAELESPAYRARIERLENLQTEVDRMMQDVYGQEKTVSSAHYANTFNNAYYRNVYEMQRQVGFQYSFSTVDFETLNQMLSMEFIGSNYSTRIWNNTQALAGDIKEQLILGFLTGKTESDMAAEFANKFATGSYEARRLIRTESNFQSTQGQKLAYEDADLEKYRNVAILDLRTSDKCREMDGTVYPVDEMQSGLNAPPFHPFCRTTTIADFGEESLANLKRRARNPITGKNELVPADTTYAKWYEKNVAHDPMAQAVEQGIKHWAADKKQWQKYRNVIGKTAAGKTFADFQEMKYNTPEVYEYTKLDYRRQHDLQLHPQKAIPDLDRNLPEPKFTKYLFGGTNTDGLAKGENFAERLGYNADNWKELQKAINKAAPKYPVKIKGSNEYGVNYEQKIILYGKNQKPANVVVAWFKDIQKNEMRMASVYIKEV